MVEFCAERGLHMGNIYFKHKFYINAVGWLEVKMEWRYGRIGAGKESYATICARSEDSVRNGKTPLRPSCCTVYI